MVSCKFFPWRPLLSRQPIIFIQRQNWLQAHKSIKRWNAAAWLYSVAMGQIPRSTERIPSEERQTPRSREVEPLEVSEIFSHLGISENCVAKWSVTYGAMIRPPWMVQMLVRQISEFPRSCIAPWKTEHLVRQFPEIPRSYKAPWTIQTFIRQISGISRSWRHEWQNT